MTHNGALTLFHRSYISHTESESCERVLLHLVRALLHTYVLKDKATINRLNSFKDQLCRPPVTSHQQHKIAQSLLSKPSSAFAVLMCLNAPSRPFNGQQNDLFAIVQPLAMLTARPWASAGAQALCTRAL